MTGLITKCYSGPEVAPDTWTAKDLRSFGFALSFTDNSPDQQFSGPYLECRKWVKELFSEGLIDYKDSIAAYREAAKSWHIAYTTDMSNPDEVEANLPHIIAHPHQPEPLTPFPYEGVDPFTISLSSAKTKKERINISRARRGLEPV